MNMGTRLIERFNARYPRIALAGRASLEAYGEIEYSTTPEFMTIYGEYGRVENQHILDVGSGCGGRSVWLALHGRNVVEGVDIDSRRIATATALAWSKQADRARFQLADACQLPYPDRTFDVVMMTDAYEHFDQPDRVMNECCRVLRPGGCVLMNWLPFRSRRGSHLYDYIHIPWAHVLLPERALVDIWKEEYARDYAAGNNTSESFTPDEIKDATTIYELQHVNKITIRHFKHYIRQGRYHCVSLKLQNSHPLLNHLCRVPWLAEYLTNTVVAVLQKTTA